MQVYHGSYVGNGTNPKGITGLGFRPDLVMIRRVGNTDVGTVYAYFATSAMAAVAFRADAAYESSLITSLDADGFTVTADAKVNFLNDTYYFVAVKDNGVADFKVGVYTGNAADGLAVTGLGFRPDYLCIHANSAITGAHTFSPSTSTNKGFQFWGGANRDDLIASLDRDGFTVNNGSASGGNEINVNGVEHAYFAFKALPGKVAVQEYTGNGADNRNISLTDTALTPVFALLKGDNAQVPITRWKQNAGDQSQQLDNSPVWTNCIQSLGAGTFQVGSDARANANTVKYSALFIADNFSSNVLRTDYAAGDPIERAAHVNARNGLINSDALGAPVSKSMTTVYQAATDGFVHIFDTGIGNTYIGYSDASNPPTTIVAENRYCLFFPEKKGNYYKVTSATGNGYLMYFYPYGA